MSRFIVVFGVLVVIFGFALHLDTPFPAWMDALGNLPGDLIVKKGNFLLYLPMTSSLLVSLVVSLITSLFK